VAFYYRPHMTRRIVSLASHKIHTMHVMLPLQTAWTDGGGVGLLGMVGMLQYGAIKDLVCHPSATQPVRRGSVGKVACEPALCLHAAGRASACNCSEEQPRSTSSPSFAVLALRLLR
jgi:hypothetical protein